MPILCILDGIELLQVWKVVYPTRSGHLYPSTSTTVGDGFFFENNELYGVRDLCAENLGVHCQGTQFAGKMSSIYGLHMRLRVVGLCYVL